MINLFEAGRSDANAARRAFLPPASDDVNALTLAANTSERTPIPTDAKFVQMSGTKDFYARFGNSSVTAAVPGDVQDGTAAVLNPAGRAIPAGVTHIAVVSAETAIVTFEFWG